MNELSVTRCLHSIPICYLDDPSKRQHMLTFYLDEVDCDMAVSESPDPARCGCGEAAASQVDSVCVPVDGKSITDDTTEAASIQEINTLHSSSSDDIFLFDEPQMKQRL